LNAAASAVNVDTMRALLALSAVPIFAAALTAQAGSEVLTQLRRLVDHVPAKAAPRDEDVVAAESELAKSMSGIVEEAGEAARELQRLFDERAARLVPSEHAPIREHDPLARTLVRFDTERVLATAPERVVAHPASSSFPGSVPAGAALVEKVLEVDLSVPGRHSTGLYAAPGALLHVTLGVEPPKGLRLRLGAHSDDIARRPSWPRLPRISRVFDLGQRATTAANAFGGLVYVEVPRGRQGTLRFGIAGAVEAPLFVLGETDAATWRERLRALPGPWAELETKKVVLTVPSHAVRELDDPTPLLQFWDRMLDAAADLAARPRDRERPERYVADVEISAGYMHSGYPIMTHLDAVADMVSLERMQNAPWGLFHELGHNHQNRDWTFAGTVEVTVNLFSLYLCETLCDKQWHAVWGGNLGRAKQKLPKVLAAGGLPWIDGGDKPDLALRLLMYWQLQQEFGWDPFKQCFAVYRELPDSERPKTENDKRDQWLVRFSRTVGRDLGGFFAAWGLSTSDEARASLRDLPAWMPADWPAKQPSGQPAKQPAESPAKRPAAIPPELPAK
jgi:hypothetical protein